MDTNSHKLHELNSEVLYKEECYTVIGVCMEIHRILGRGLSEIVYKDAMEYEFQQKNMSVKALFIAHRQSRAATACLMRAWRVISDSKAKPNVRC